MSKRKSNFREHPTPPSWADRFLDWYCSKRFLEEIQGDLYEIFEDTLSEKGLKAAKWQFIILVFRFLKPFRIKRLEEWSMPYFNSAMILHYLKTTYRNLIRFKGFSILNILGLAIGMAACILILRYVNLEMSYDKFHPKADQLFRVHVFEFDDGRWGEEEIYTSFALGPTLKANLPQIENFTRVLPWYNAAVLKVKDSEGKEQTYFEEKGLFVDSSFLQMFGFQMIEGNAETALASKSSMLLSESKAQKYFGTTQGLIGKTIQFNGDGLEKPFTIQGIFKDIPVNTHLEFDLLLSFQDVLTNGQYSQDDGWGWFNFMTYIQAGAVTDTATLVRIAEAAIKPHVRSGDMGDDRFVPKFYPVQDIHLYSENIGELTPSGNAKSVSFFVLIAILIMVIAWVNYINLSTARAMERAREIGIRKTVGALRGQVRRQFLFESLFVNMLAALIAIGLALILMPYLSELIGKDLYGSYQQDNKLWWVLAGGIFGGALLSGLYPAFVLSAYKPIHVLKGMKAKVGKGISLRKVLVVLQFAASAGLIAGTLAVYNQTTFIKDQDLGMDLDQIVILKGPRIFPEDADKKERIRTFKTEMKAIPGVENVAGAGNVPGGSYDFGTSIRKLGQEASEAQQVQIVWVDNDFLDTYGIELLAGKKFSDDFKEAGPLINEALARKCGLGSPDEAINERLYVNGDTISIFGVLKDYSWYSMRQAHIPFILLPSSRASNKLCVKVKSQDLPETLDKMNEVYSSAFPGNPFDYYFQDEFFNRQYQEDQQFGSIFGLFTGFALFVACLGLLGLASFSATIRIKEIGIRKVLGATNQELLVLLAKDFMLLVGIALLIGLPLSWWFTHGWLQEFPYRITLGVWFFAAPALLVSLIAALTIGFRTLRTAKMNPVKALRYE